jgi:hypothetical protein
VFVREELHGQGSAFEWSDDHIRRAGEVIEDLPGFAVVEGEGEAVLPGVVEEVSEPSLDAGDATDEGPSAPEGVSIKRFDSYDLSAKVGKEARSQCQRLVGEVEHEDIGERERHG